MARKRIIAANWKMHKTADQTKLFFDKIKQHLVSLSSHQLPRVLIAAPYTLIALAAELSESTLIEVGAQNMNDATEGAFTGEVAASMLKEAKATFVIVGHSERRHIFKEDNQFINRKVKKALQEGLTPLLCIGETKLERDGHQTEEVLATQLNDCLEGVEEQLIEKIIIAYEPVWAIGTGLTATPQLAQQAHLFCREYLQQHWGKQASEKISLLYGGSVNAKTAKELMSQPDIDGLLIGGASLDPDSFAKIIEESSVPLQAEDVE